MKVQTGRIGRSFAERIEIRGISAITSRRSIADGATMASGGNSRRLPRRFCFDRFVAEATF